MALLTTQQINAAFYANFGKNATRAELDYWLKKTDAELKAKIAADPNSKMYQQQHTTTTSPNAGTTDALAKAKQSVLIAYNSAFPGEKNLNGVAIPKDTFINYWANRIVKEGNDLSLRDALRADQYAGGVYQQWRESQQGPTTGNTVYDEILKSMRDMLDELKKRGQTVNPNIEITPEQAAEFMQKAEGEINPYYAGQLKLAKEGLLTSVGYDKTQIDLFEQRLAKQFKQGFQQVGEGAAEAGFALSGKRMTQEGNLAEQTQQQIDDQRRALESRTGELSRAFAQQYAGLPGYEQPTFDITGAPKVTSAGAYEFGTGQNPIYTLSPEIYNQLIGSQEFARRGATSTRESELEAAFRESEALKQQKALTI